MLKKRGQLSRQFAYAVLSITVLIVSIMAYRYITRQQSPTPSNPFLASSQPSTPNANPFLSKAPAAPVDCSQEKTNTEMDVCWQTKAVDEKNHIYCNSIENANPFVSKDLCFNLVAQTKKDTSICSFIESPDMKKNCEDVTKNPLPQAQDNAGTSG